MIALSVTGSTDCKFLKGTEAGAIPTPWQLSLSEPPTHAVVDRYAVFCCSHVELEIFEVYFHFFAKQWGL